MIDKRIILNRNSPIVCTLKEHTLFPFVAEHDEFHNGFLDDSDE